MRSAEDERAGAPLTTGAKAWVAIALLTQPQRLRLALLTAARVVVGFCDLALAAAMYVLFMLLQGQAPAHRYSWLPSGIISAAEATGLLVVVRVLADILSSHASFREIQNLATDLMLRLTRGYCELKWARFVELNRSELTSIAVHATREAADFYHRCVEMIAGAVIVIAMTAAFVYQSPPAACCFAVALATLYCIHRLIICKRVQQSASLREESLGQLQRDLSGLFSSGKETRAYGNPEFFYDRIRRQAGLFALGTRRCVFLPQAARIIADQGTVLLFLSLIVAVQLRQRDTHQLLSLLVFYFVLSRRLLPLVGQLSLIAGQMESSFENVRIVDVELKRCHLNRAVSLPATNPGPGLALEVEQVTFAFNGGPLILHNANLLLSEGEIAVLRGASGIGKTSLLNIVAGVLPPASGSVRVDRDGLAYVPQEIILLDDTIRNNLLFGLRRTDDGELMRALTVSCLDELVAALPHGLDSGVGDNGALFSGGERQRFGLARAALRGSRLLLLDEATSMLDEKTELQVLNNLAETGAAILLVTHRRHPYRWAHSVYRLEGGRMIEERRSTAPAIHDLLAAMAEPA